MLLNFGYFSQWMLYIKAPHSTMSGTAMVPKPPSRKSPGATPPPTTTPVSSITSSRRTNLMRQHLLQGGSSGWDLVVVELALAKDPGRDNSYKRFQTWLDTTFNWISHSSCHYILLSWFYPRSCLSLIVNLSRQNHETCWLIPQNSQNL